MSQDLDGQDANLSRWVDFYIVEDELGKEFVIGSYGPQPQASLPAGTLHWGKNVVTTAEVLDPNITATFNEQSDDDYVKYEAMAVTGDSGAGWFIKVGPEWKLVTPSISVGAESVHGLKFSFYWSAFDLFHYVEWVDDKICEMNAARPPEQQEEHPRPKPDVTDTAWEAGVDDDWGNAANWSSGVPTSSDVVRVDNTVTAVISTQDAQAKELAVGYVFGYHEDIDDDCDEQTPPEPPAVTEGAVTQTGGSATIENGLYLGVHGGMQGTYTISGGQLTAHKS